MYKNYGKAKAGRSRAQAGKKKMVKDPKTGKMVPDFAVDGKGPNDRAQIGKSRLVEEDKEVKFDSSGPKAFGKAVKDASKKIQKTVQSGRNKIMGTDKVAKTPFSKEKAKAGKRRKAQVGAAISPAAKRRDEASNKKQISDLESRIAKAKGTPEAKPLIAEYRRRTNTGKMGRKRGQFGLIKGGLAAGKALLQGKGLKGAAAAGVGAALPGPLGTMAEKGINAVGGGQQDPNAAAAPVDPNAAPQQPQDPNATAKRGKKRGLKDRRKSRRKAKMGNYGIEKTASGKKMADTLGVKKNKKGSKR